MVDEAEDKEFFDGFLVNDLLACFALPPSKFLFGPDIKDEEAGEATQAPGDEMSPKCIKLLLELMLLFSRFAFRALKLNEEDEKEFSV